jgi:hypothetical protein
MKNKTMLIIILGMSAQHVWAGKTSPEDKKNAGYEEDNIEKKEELESLDNFGAKYKVTEIS